MSDNVVAVATSEPVKTQGEEPQPVKKENQVYGKQNDANMPLEVYERENHRDFSIEALNLNEDPSTLPYGINKQAKKISEYIQGQIKEKGLEPTTESYKQVLKSLRRELGINDNIIQEIMLDRITGYIESLETLKSLKELDDPQLIKELRKLSSKKDMEKFVMMKVEKYIK